MLTMTTVVADKKKIKNGNWNELSNMVRDVLSDMTGNQHIVETIERDNTIEVRVRQIKN